MPWKNFSIWKGRLPHWRADEVTYYVTFRHRRPLSFDECHLLYSYLLRPEGKGWHLAVLCVLPSATELMFKVGIGKSGRPTELSSIVEKAKNKAAKVIMKKTQERIPPFFQESYDRIVRDEAEFEERFLSILGSPENEEAIGTSENYDFLYVPQKQS